MPRKTTKIADSSKSQEETLLEAVAHLGGTNTVAPAKKRKVVIDSDSTAVPVPVPGEDDILVVAEEVGGPAGDQLSFDTQAAAATFLKQLYGGPNGRVLITDTKWSGGHNFRLICKGCEQFQASCIRSRGSKKLMLSPRSVLEHGPEHEEKNGTYERSIPQRSKTPKVEPADTEDDESAVAVVKEKPVKEKAVKEKEVKEKGRGSKNIAALKKKFNLQPHPEGGYFAETYRSDRKVAVGKESVAASTAIYYLVPATSVSKLHRIKYDEVWHFYLGGPLVVVELGEEGVKETVLGTEINSDQVLQHVVKGGTWFGCYPKNTNNPYSLVGCTVAPGFLEKDMEMGDKATLLKDFPTAAEIIEKLTAPST